MGRRGSFATGSTELHHAALEGSYEQVEQILDKHEHLVNVRDENGWSALHEAVRRGMLDVVKILLDRGAEVNAQTGKQQTGDSPLGLAMRFHGPDHDVTKFLESRGAKQFPMQGTEL